MKEKNRKNSLASTVMAIVLLAVMTITLVIGCDKSSLPKHQFVNTIKHPAEQIFKQGCNNIHVYYTDANDQYLFSSFMLSPHCGSHELAISRIRTIKLPEELKAQLRDDWNTTDKLGRIFKDVPAGEKPYVIGFEFKYCFGTFSWSRAKYVEIHMTKENKLEGGTYEKPYGISKHHKTRTTNIHEIK